MSLSVASDPRNLPERTDVQPLHLEKACSSVVRRRRLISVIASSSALVEFSLSVVRLSGSGWRSTLVVSLSKHAEARLLGMCGDRLRYAGFSYFRPGVSGKREFAKGVFREQREINLLAGLGI